MEERVSEHPSEWDGGQRWFLKTRYRKTFANSSKAMD